MTAATVSEQENSHRETFGVFRLPPWLIETCVFSVMVPCIVGWLCQRSKLSVWNGTRAITVETKLYCFCLKLWLSDDTNLSYPLLRRYVKTQKMDIVPLVGIVTNSTNHPFVCDTSQIRQFTKMGRERPITMLSATIFAEAISFSPKCHCHRHLGPVRPRYFIPYLHSMYDCPLLHSDILNAWWL